MSNAEHLLEIYDTENYSGPNPLRLTGHFTVFGPENSRYYILTPNVEITIHDKPVMQFAVRPRYDQDPIQNVIQGCCTVMINLPPDNIEYAEKKMYGFDGFEFWHAGKISPAH